MTVAIREWTKNPEIIDLTDLDIFAEREPHEEFRILRNEYPLYWNPEADPEPGFWNVTKYADIKFVGSHPELFSSAQGINIALDPAVSAAVGPASGIALGTAAGSMITMDPPMHVSYRKIANPWFTARAVAGLEDRVRELTRKYLDEVAPRGECEFMTEIAARLPIAVLCDILGVPHADEAKIFEWSNKLIGLDDPDLGPENDAEVASTFMALFAYGQRMIADRRSNPREDLMTAIAHAEYEGKPIPPMLLNGFFLLMVIAGNETTRNTVTGGIKALIEHPDQRRKLIENPGLIPTAVEEILRWVSAVAYMRRTATQDVEMHGRKIAAGDKIVMWYGAANRDEDVFANPDVFDVRRDPNEHLAFGYGQHRCLGARLAQLQLRVMIGEILARIPDMEFNGEVRRLRSNFINGIKCMPVKFTPVK
jgi:linalool 8-monooxygenase